MKIERPPELADGGFWYVVPVDTIQRGRWVRNRPRFPGSFTSVPLGDGTAAVRSPVPVVGVDTLDVSAGKALQVLGRVVRPRGRIGGR